MRRRLWESLPVRALRRYIDADAGTWATAIAWNALLVVIPIVLVAAGLLSAALHVHSLQERMVTIIAARAGHGAAAGAVSGVRNSTALLSVGGLAGLLWRGSSLFGAVDKGLARISGDPTRPFLNQRAMAMGMSLLFTVLIVPLLLNASLVAVMRTLGLTPSHVLSGRAVPVVQFVVGWADATLIFAAIYRLVPRRRRRGSPLLPGALAAGLMLETLTQVFPLFIRSTSDFSTYGLVLGALFLLVGYFFFVGVITLLGCCVNAEWKRWPGDDDRVVP